MNGLFAYILCGIFCRLTLGIKYEDCAADSNSLTIGARPRCIKKLDGKISNSWMQSWNYCRQERGTLPHVYSGKEKGKFKDWLKAIGHGSFYMAYKRLVMGSTDLKDAAWFTNETAPLADGNKLSDHFKLVDEANYPDHMEGIVNVETQKFGYSMIPSPLYRQVYCEFSKPTFNPKFVLVFNQTRGQTHPFQQSPVENVNECAMKCATKDYCFGFNYVENKFVVINKQGTFEKPGCLLMAINRKDYGRSPEPDKDSQFYELIESE